MSIAITSMLSKKAFDRGVVLIADDLVLADEEKGKYKGGYVKEPNVGMFFDVLGYDFASLFPSIMMALNISVDSYLGKMNQDKISYTDHNGKRCNITDEHIKAASGAIYYKPKSSMMRDILIDLIDSRLFAKNTADEIDAEIAELEKLLKTQMI